MIGTEGVVGRVEEFGSRWYVDPTDASSFYESVTAAISCASGKPWLTSWAAKLAAEYAVDHIETVGLVLKDTNRAAAIDLVKGQARRYRDMKADIGSHQHHVIEALILDMPIPSVPDELVDVEIDGERIDHDAITDGFLNFVIDHNPDFLLAEATVAHAVLGYAGTLDTVVFLPAMNRTLLIDAKTGSNLDLTMSAQLAAYRNATEVWVDHMGNKIPMPKVDGAAVLHIRRDYARGYKLLEVPCGEWEFAWFRQMLEVAKGHRSSGKLKYQALYPPLPDGSQPPPLLEDLDGLGRYVKPLGAVGIHGLLDVAAHTPEQLRAIKGVGPAAIEALSVVLSAHNLAFTNAHQEVA